MPLPRPNLIQTDVPLDKMTTLGVGGPARYFATTKNIDELLQLLQWAYQKSVRVLFLGGGSNLLVSDGGFDGLVLQYGGATIEINDGSMGEHITAQAGALWDDVVAMAVSADLAGVECLSGIPGSVGAAPVQNIGAYGQELSGTLLNLDVIDVQSMRQQTIEAQACGFGYRRSCFKTEVPPRFLITQVKLKLCKHGRPTLNYGGLADRLHRNVAPSLRKVRQAVLEMRREKSMDTNASDPNTQSAGSFFTNPIVSHGVALQLQQQCKDTVMPQFVVDQNHVKLSAAWLIEHAGFVKGHRAEAVGLSSKHCLAIITGPGANANDVVRLAVQIRNAVMQRYGISLVPEPSLIGFDDATMASLGL